MRDHAVPRPPQMADIESRLGVRDAVKSAYKFFQSLSTEETQFRKDLVAELNILDWAAPIASASSIAPLGHRQPVTGSVDVSTIATIGSYGHLILLAEHGFSLVTGGNIGAAATIPAQMSIGLFFNFTDNLWYPLLGVVGDITGGTYTNEQAQDTIGTILIDSATIDLTYDDGVPSITAIVKDGSITAAKVAADVATQAELNATQAEVDATQAALDAHAATLHSTPLRQVIMFRTADGGNDPVTDPAIWVVHGADGTPISTPGTTTQGLQEAIDYAATTGMDLLVLGGPVKPDGDDPSIISCTSTITFPPWQKGQVAFQGVTINIGGNPDVGMQFDSCMAFDFQWRGGQIVCGVNTEIGVLFKPSNELFLDPAGPVITSSKFLFPSIVMFQAGGICARFDVDLAGIGEGNVFEFIEPNGGAYGIQLVGDASNAFRGNTVRVYGAHAQTSFCVAAGINSTGAANIRGNNWDIECDPAAAGGGVDIWGVNDIFKIAVLGDEGPGTVGIKLESSAAKNVVIGTEIVATTPLQDASTSLDNIIIMPRTATYVATNVTTDRTFDADTVAVAELADVVGTLISDLRAWGFVL